LLGTTRGEAAASTGLGRSDFGTAGVAAVGVGLATAGVAAGLTGEGGAV
jgi:hypothetical protein